MERLHSYSAVAVLPRTYIHRSRPARASRRNAVPAACDVGEADGAKRVQGLSSWITRLRRQEVKLQGGQGGRDGSGVETGHDAYLTT